MTAEIDRPHLLWDGECGFCKRWVDYWRELTGDAVVYVPFQEAAELMAAHDVDEVETAQAVHLLMPNGRVYRAGEAVLRTLKHAPHTRFRLYLDLYRLPGVSDVIEGTYRRVAAHRVAAARVTQALWGRPHRETFSMAQFLFTRLLAVAAFVAFWSLWQQTAGLFGPHGIFPFEDFMAQATEWGREKGRNPLLVFPSIFWWLGASGSTLNGAAIAGMGAAVAMFVGIAPRLMVVLLWGLYLSFMSLDQLFFGYQWDALLLESLFVALFFVPSGVRPRLEMQERPGGRWLTWLLLTKLMFMAGLVKLLAHDSAWTDLTALDYHFWTQPIPNAVAPLVAALPGWILQAGVLFTLFAETLVPLLVFAPRRLRHFGAIAMMALQVMILTTGTYGFFNLVALALCITLLDDESFGRSRFTTAVHEVPRSHAMVVLGAVLVFAALLLAPADFHYILVRAVSFLVPLSIVAVTLVALRSPEREVLADLRGLALAIAIPLVALAPLLPTDARALVAPLRTFNQYGLFASMTKDRPEIIVEWSHDGTTWTPYDFEYKVTAIDEPLRPTTFHMPRIDWQMWFAALGDCERTRWLPRFADRLLHGTPEVEALLQGGVPDEPPRFVRMTKYYYELGGEPWSRKEQGPFCPTFALNEVGELVVVER